MTELSDKEKQVIANCLRYRRNALMQMSQQDQRLHGDFVAFVIEEGVILDKLQIPRE